MNAIPSPMDYAKPLVVNDPAQCYFYHRIDIPGFGETTGDWDLRDCIKPYLGNYDFKG